MTTIELGPGALDDISIPDYVSVDSAAIMRIFGWTNRTSINKNIGKRIPPSMVRGRHEWTVGQIRDWRMRQAKLVNDEAERRAEECAKLAAMGTVFERAALH